MFGRNIFLAVLLRKKSYTYIYTNKKITTRNNTASILYILYSNAVDNMTNVNV